MNDDSLFESTGMAHMDAAHNSLFAIPESTMEIGVDLMDDGMSVGLSSGGPVSTAGYGVGSSTLPFDLSTDGSSAGRNLGDNSSVLATSEDPESAAYAIGGTCILGTGATTSNGGPEGVIIFFKNDRPNSYVEKNAASIYNALHGNPEKNYMYPAVISESPDGFETAVRVFGGNSLEQAKDTLDIWEAILEEYVQ